MSHSQTPSRRVATNPKRSKGLIQRREVVHLIDGSLDTAYFRSIAGQHDRDRFPVAIGSIAPPGALQRRLESMAIPTFSLRVPRRAQYPLAIIRLAQLLRQRQALLHAHCFDPTLVGLLAARLARVPFVFTRHHSDHNLRLGKKWHTRIDSWCARHADHVIAVSEATAQILTGIEGAPPGQITVVYNGMEKLPAVPPGTVESTRREFGINSEHVCLMVARLHEEKGHRFLLEAIPAIRQQVGAVIFLLAGDGPQRNGLEADVRARGLSACVRFLGRRNDMAALYSLADIVTLPSLAESFGFAVLEAMSVGKPVVAAATGGMPELLNNGEGGLVVPQADSGALAASISKVLLNPDLARQLGESGKRRANLFTLERMIRGYEDVYCQVLGYGASDVA